MDRYDGHVGDTCIKDETMRIVTEGDPKKVHWWIGELGTCESCETVIEFEATDDPELLHSRPLCLDIAALPCPVCGTRIDVTRYTGSEI